MGPAGWSQSNLRPPGGYNPANVMRQRLGTRLRLAAAAALVASLVGPLALAQEPTSAPATLPAAPNPSLPNPAAQDHAPVSPAGSQEPSASAPRDLSGLSPRITLLRNTLVPGQPVRVRFELWNTTGEVIDIPFLPRVGSPDAMGLPESLIFGPDAAPALSVSFESEPGVFVRPETRLETGAELTGRLGPHACIGAEIDLARHYKAIQYSGMYRLEWRPFPTLPAATADFRVERRKNVVIVTDYGKISFTLFYDEAPQNVENFLELVRAKFYQGKTFNRIVAGFLIQGGSPDGSRRGMRPDGRTVPAEFSNHPFDLGTVAMVRKPSDPHSASCQFLICLGRHPEWDGQYTVIGQIRDEESLRTLQTLSQLQTDTEGTPLKPVVMQFVTLVDADRQTGRVETLGSP